MKELNKKISGLLRYRVRYADKFKENPRIRHCLTESSSALTGLTQLVLGWAFSSLAWDLLKYAVSNFLKKHSKGGEVPNDIEFARNAKLLKRFVTNVKKSLIPFPKLNKKLRAYLEEEIMTHVLTDLLINHPGKTLKEISRKRTFKKELAVIMKKQTEGVDFKPTKKEITEIKKYFRKYLS